jgi:16S rRNA (adenine1518-N6/adenine1519-N6)-dimethyltransferase
VTRAHEADGGITTLDHEGKLRPAHALVAAGVRPHKSKGQNFLVQPRVADRIVAAAEISEGDDVVEIGPGLGILSDRLAERPVRRLILIELDQRLAAQLTLRFANDSRVVVIDRDFLSMSSRDLLAPAPPRRDVAPAAPREAQLRVVSNLPFNVAAAILERLCAMQQEIARMVLMFQREVGGRIRARPRDRNYGALSVYTAMYWQIDGHFRVSAGSFHPQPKVDAEVLTFAPRRPLPFAADEERSVLKTVRAVFSAPRKTLRNAVGRALAIAPSVLEAAFVRVAIDPDARAATLAVDDLVRLARALHLNPCPAKDRDA